MKGAENFTAYAHYLPYTEVYVELFSKIWIQR